MYGTHKPYYLHTSVPANDDYQYIPMLASYALTLLWFMTLKLKFKLKHFEKKEL
jgi:hypothetical protein